VGKLYSVIIICYQFIVRIGAYGNKYYEEAKVRDRECLWRVEIKGRPP
jgi:hypothetical protein